MARGKLSKYTDKMGRYHTKALFVETLSPELAAKGIKPVYTLNGDPTYTDIHDMFLASNDPTGYTFALAAFDSWDHLQHMLNNCQWFRRHYDKWQNELEVKMRSEAIRNLVKQSKDSKGSTAAKYVAEKGWEKKRGRPSKEELEKEKKQREMISNELSEDAGRIGLH